MRQASQFHRLTAVILLCILLAGCRGITPTPIGGNSADPATASPSATPQSSAAPAQISPYAHLKPTFALAGQPYEPVSVQAKVAPYTIAADLSNIENLDQFPSLTQEQRAALANNGFVVAPGNMEQLFYIYEDNTYKKIPNFVTSDSVLQVYHIFYDYALRSMEYQTLLPNMLALNSNMIAQLQKDYEAISQPDVKAGAMKALAYFGVAQCVMGEDFPPDFPREAADIVRKELALIQSPNGQASSPLFGHVLDYSLFTPRGHYTRSEELKLFFLGMSWYGTASLPLYKEGNARNTEMAILSVLLSNALYSLPQEDGLALWDSIYSPTAFFVGEADDITPFQLQPIIQQVYGSELDLNAIADGDKIDAFYLEADKLPRPLISQDDVVQVRFMGQRYIPDSEILQNLSTDVLRPFPAGLDVFASLGSQRAEEIIATQYRPQESWPEYGENFSRMKDKFTSLPQSTWQSNMYYAWLWTQNSLTGAYGEGYPLFMQNNAWQDKSLATALGSWAEMRHDTILYAKGSGAECGGDVVPPVVRAYVEPNPEFFNRLLWLTSYMRENLLARNVLPESIEYVCMNLEDMLVFLRDCAVKELNGEDLTTEEYDTLLTYGGWLEYLTTSCVEDAYDWYQIESETDRNMALIADVHTATPGGYLEVGVGPAAEIYVVAPMGGKLYLTRGAVFDYFEFVSQQRLTDEQWQQMLKEAPPQRPPFTSSFMEGEAMEVPAPLEPYSTGC